MKNFLVTWQIDVDADNPIEAALEAKKVCNGMDFNADSANVFSVTDPQTSESSTIDLSETTLPFEDMRATADQLVDFELFHNENIRNIEEWVLRCLNVHVYPVVNPLTDFFYVLDVANPELKELFANYKTRLKIVNELDHEFETHLDFIEFITDTGYSGEIPGVAIVVAEYLADSGYPTVSSFCAEHGVSFEDIKIA